jgi:bifunctional non-homologous end joining protein LigD
VAKERLELEVGGRELSIPNPDKVLYPDDGITKREIVAYHERIGPLLVRHSAGRPVALHRFPDGIGKGGFFQKQRGKHFPDWIRTVELDTRDGSTEFVVIEDVATLVYLAGQGVLVLHTLFSRADAPYVPVEVMIDLDPSSPDRAPVRHAAGRLRELFADRGYEARVKTSGSRGLHVVVDVELPDFPAARALALEVSEELVAEEPDEFTLEFYKEKRKGRLLLDINRNAYQQHAVAPYSLRALPGAPVAAPLEWDEALDPKWDPQRWTIKNLFRRLAQRPDPWARDGTMQG